MNKKTQKIIDKSKEINNRKMNNTTLTGQTKDPVDVCKVDTKLNNSSNQNSVDQLFNKL